MCGIVGVASTGPMSVPMKEFFQSLLFHDVVRGAHATGVAAIDTMTRDLVVEKRAVDSSRFLNNEEIMENLFSFKHNFNIYIGHNRYATVGDKTKDENAHPFIHGDIVGVHNGSLRNQSLLDDHKDFVVDSDNLYHHLAKNGLANTVSKTNGAYALCWYDRTDNSLNFIRNDERPLCIGKLTNGCWVWASEYSMLTWLVGRHKSLQFDTYMEEGVKVREVYNIKKNTHVKFVFKDKTRQFDGAYTIEEHVPPEFPTRNYYGGTWDDTHGYSSSRYTSGVDINKRVTHVPIKNEAQKRAQEQLDKVFVGAKQHESMIETTFLGNVKSKAPGSVYEATIALFEYINRSGKRVLFHSFAFHKSLTNDWDETKIGTKVYGMIGSISIHTGTTYECIRNEEFGHTFAVTHITEKCPNKYYPTRKEGMADQNVLPFRGVASKQEATQESCSTGEGSNNLAYKLEEESGLKVQLANGFCSKETFVKMMSANCHRCAECGGVMTKLTSGRIWLYQHHDQIEGEKFDYLMCKKVCYDNMIEVCDEMDKDYTTRYGANNE